MRKKRTVLALICFSALILCSCKGFEEQLIYNKAQKLHDSGKVSEAIIIYEKLLKSDPENKIDPGNAIVMYDLAVAYIDTGKRRKAKDLAEKLKKMRRGDLAREVEKLLYVDESINY